MKRIITILIMVMALTFCASAQNSVKLYDEKANPLEQIDSALKTAKKSGKYVICQVGGNWCVWCTRFADFITKDSEINQIVKDNFVYIHIDYDKKKPHNAEMNERLGNAGRFGFPCMVVLDANGKVLHIQDSSFLEEDKSYNKAKVLRFFKSWTPAAVTTPASR